MTLPDDLAEAVETYQQTQEAPPSLTTVVQTALRQYLSERGFLRVRRTLTIEPANKGSGLRDISQRHDHYLVVMGDTARTRLRPKVRRGRTK